MTNFAYSPNSSLPSEPGDLGNPASQTSWWQRQSIRFKTTALAIAIGTIPTLAIGSIAYYFAANSMEQQSSELRKTIVADLQGRVNVFMGDRLNDIEMMAGLSIFTDPELQQTATAAEKSAALQRIQDAYGFYDSIAVFDAQGDFVAKTDGKSLGNHLNRGYIQAAIEADGAIISPPRISTTTGTYSIYTAAPIKDDSGQTIGFVRARMPVAVLRNLLEPYIAEGSEYYLLDRQGKIFLGSAGEYVVKTLSNESAVENKTYSYEAVNVREIFQNTDGLLASPELAADVVVNAQTQTEQFIAFAPSHSRLRRKTTETARTVGQTVTDLPDLNWQAILATDSAIVFAPQRRLRQIFMLGTGLVALGVGAIAYVWTKRLLYPILQAASAVQNIGRGDFQIRVSIEGADEVAQLGVDINHMADRLASFVETQTLLARQSEGLKNITLQLVSATEQMDILEAAVIESYHTLNANRVIYYQFDSEQTGTVRAESVNQSDRSVLGTDILTPDLVAKYHAQYRQGDNWIGIVNNPPANSTQSLAEVNSLQTNASLIAPVAIEDRLDGLLIAYHYATPRSWLDEEAEFISQVAAQIGLATARLNSIERQKLAEIREKSAREAMQSRALSLLQEVYSVSEGDLTIRAKVSDDEIGTIADSYNSTIESLQKLLNRTKSAAAEVKLNTSANDLAVQSLAQAAVTQATEIVQMLERVRQMEQSIALVSSQATQAEEFVRQANLTIDRGDKSMDRTVVEINAVQNTVKQTATKAEKLGESSQEISQAVNSIGRFAAQTHLLALKASIEAARAGEQGKGFAVIAEEVRSLATQSAEATAEIETLVGKIQLETGELVEAMNQGTAQIASGNHLVQQTRQSLTQVTQAGSEIGKLVDSITQATQQQLATSAKVSQTIDYVAEIANNNSQSATEVSNSIGQLSAIADRLQSDIDRFKT